jgi:hypothetical protein
MTPSEPNANNPKIELGSGTLVLLTALSSTGKDKVITSYPWLTEMAISEGWG